MGLAAQQTQHNIGWAVATCCERCLAQRIGRAQLIPRPGRSDGPTDSVLLHGHDTIRGVHRYLEDLIELDLPEGDWALFGSGPLLLRGWIDDVGDLDVISRGPAWEKASSVGVPEKLKEDGNTIVRIGEGVTVGHTWPFGPETIDNMIDTAEMVQGLPCVRLEYVEAYMRLFDRPKDRERLEIIEANR